jgi:PHP family Zn ribbon phosphoesterase
MSMITCSYCDIEINTRDVEAEDGRCPECGAMIIPAGVRKYDDDDESSGRTDNSEYEYTLEEENELGKDN